MSSGRGQVVEVELGRCRQLLVDDLVAEIDALVANAVAGARDQLDLTLALAAAPEKLFVAFGCAGHVSCTPVSGNR